MPRSRRCPRRSCCSLPGPSGVRPIELLDLGSLPLTPRSTIAASYTLLNPAHHQYMGLLAACIGGVHLLLARNFEARSKGQNLTLGVALAFVTLAVPIQFAGFRVTIAWALEGAVLAWLSARSRELLAACRLLERADAGDLPPAGSGRVPLLAKLRILDVAEHAFPDVRRVDHGTLALGEISRASSSSPCLKNTFR